MPKVSRTYRLVATLTGFLVLVGVCFPAGVQAQHFMMEHCELPIPVAETTQHEDCEATHQYDTSHHTPPTTDHSDNGRDCDMDFACACSLDSAPARPLAIQLFSKTFVGFYPVVVECIGEIEHQTTFASNTLESEVHEASPPLFLKNSSFLN